MPLLLVKGPIRLKLIDSLIKQTIVIFDLVVEIWKIIDTNLTVEPVLQHVADVAIQGEDNVPMNSRVNGNALENPAALLRILN